MSKTKERFFPYDATKYLEYDEDIVAYLVAALHDEDPRVFAIAMGDVLRAGNVSQVAREVGVTREGLYKAFSADGNPSFSTVTKVLRALGLRISVKFAASAESRKAEKSASLKAMEPGIELSRKPAEIFVGRPNEGRRVSRARKGAAPAPLSSAQTRGGEKRRSKR